MKVSDMTNEELTKALMRRVPLDSNNYDDIREAAARLRLKQQSDNYAAAMCRQEAEYKREICDLCQRLKIAEVALEKIDNMCDGDMCKFFDNTHHCSACRYLDECQTGVAHAALAAIRGRRGQSSVV